MSKHYEAANKALKEIESVCDLLSRFAYQDYFQDLTFVQRIVFRQTIISMILSLDCPKVQSHLEKAYSFLEKYRNDLNPESKEDIEVSKAMSAINDMWGFLESIRIHTGLGLAYWNNCIRRVSEFKWLPKVERVINDIVLSESRKTVEELQNELKEAKPAEAEVAETPNDQN